MQPKTAIRYKLILQIISEENIFERNELLLRLKDNGIIISPETLSKDLRELCIKRGDNRFKPKRIPNEPSRGKYTIQREQIRNWFRAQCRVNPPAKLIEAPSDRIPILLHPNTLRRLNRLKVIIKLITEEKIPSQKALHLRLKDNGFNTGFQLVREDLYALETIRCGGQFTYPLQLTDPDILAWFIDECDREPMSDLVPAPSGRAAELIPEWRCGCGHHNHHADMNCYECGIAKPIG